ncbi:MAG: thiamine pyrophosphate-dependent enzyme [Desulfopila sp.]
MKAFVIFSAWLEMPSTRLSRPSAARFTIDTGTSVIWTSNSMSFFKKRRIVGAFNHGSMAVVLPAAIGAQFQFPDRKIWGIVGDGAFNMTLQDFSTAVEYGLPTKLIVLNNAQLGFVKIEMEEAGIAPNLEALQVNNFNFAEFAKLVGGDGVRVEEAKDVESALQRAKAATKPFIVDAIVNSGELSMPPRIGWSEVKGFGISKAKEVVQALRGDRRQWDNIKKEIEGYFD